MGEYLLFVYWKASSVLDFDNLGKSADTATSFSHKCHAEGFHAVTHGKTVSNSPHPWSWLGPLDLYTSKAASKHSTLASRTAFGPNYWTSPNNPSR